MRRKTRQKVNFRLFSEIQAVLRAADQPSDIGQMAVDAQAAEHGGPGDKQEGLMREDHHHEEGECHQDTSQRNVAAEENGGQADQYRRGAVAREHQQDDGGGDQTDDGGERDRQHDDRVDQRRFDLAGDARRLFHESGKTVEDGFHRAGSLARAYHVEIELVERFRML